MMENQHPAFGYSFTTIRFTVLDIGFYDVLGVMETV